jgi:G patch domain-containing protein 1
METAKSLSTAAGMSISTVMGMGGATTAFSEGAVTLDELMRQAQEASQLENSHDGDNTHGGSSIGGSISGGLVAPKVGLTPQTKPQAKVEEAKVNADVNEALEGKRAQDEVLRAIFGDSSDDED